MYVFIQCDVYIGMSQNLAEAFYIHAAAQALRCKSMSECMKISVHNMGGLQYSVKMVLHRARFNEFLLHSRQQKTVF